MVDTAQNIVNCEVDIILVRDITSALSVER